jgi:hypothetical protein
LLRGCATERHDNDSDRPEFASVRSGELMGIV